MFDHDECGAMFAVIGQQPLFQMGQHGQVHPAGRFVQQHDTGTGHEGHRGIDQLLLAIGQRAGFGIAIGGKVEELDQLLGLLGQARVGRAEQPAQHRALMLLSCKDDVVDHRHLGKDRKLLERAPDAHQRQVGRAHAIGRLAVDPAMPLRRAQLPEDAVEQRRLARAVGTDQAQNLALLHIETDVVDGADAAELL